MNGSRRRSSPTIRNNNIYRARIGDDKGQTYILIKAVEGLLKQHGKLPVNVKFLIEGEEEVGGEHIEAYVKRKPARLKADAAVICDTEMFAPELPTICVGLRGIVYGEMHRRRRGPRSALRRVRRRRAESDASHRRDSLTLKDREGTSAFPDFMIACSRPAKRSAQRGPAFRSTSRSTKRKKSA